MSCGLNDEREQGEFPGSSVVKTRASTAGGTGLIPGLETKISHARWHGQLKRENEGKGGRWGVRFVRTCGKNLRHERATPALVKGVNPDGSRSLWEAPISSLTVGLGGNPDLADGPGDCVCRDVLRVTLTPEMASFTFGGSCSGERSRGRSCHRAAGPSPGSQVPRRPRSPERPARSSGLRPLTSAASRRRRGRGTQTAGRQRAARRKALLSRWFRSCFPLKTGGVRREADQLGQEADQSKKRKGQSRAR